MASPARCDTCQRWPRMGACLEFFHSEGYRSAHFVFAITAGDNSERLHSSQSERRGRNAEVCQNPAACGGAT